MIEADDAWACAVGSDNGLPVLLRCRTNLAAIASRGSHRRLLRIVWRYNATDPSGLPPPELSEPMAALEDALFGELERDLLAVLAWVRLSGGVKEWGAYLSDAQRTCERLNLALESHDPFPIELSVEDDPNWDVYESFLNTVEPEGERQ